MLQARQAVVQRRRIETIVKLAEIIAKEPIKRVFAEVVTDRLKFGVDPAETAFMLFCERVQLLMAAQKSHSILIGDQDDEQMKNMIRRFNAYRLTGTFWDYGIAIENVVDSVYFARLHYSRMLQLADAYIFIVSHKFTKSRKGWMAEKLREELKDKMQPVMHKYKAWPSPNVEF